MRPMKIEEGYTFNFEVIDKYHEIQKDALKRKRLEKIRNFIN